MRNENTVLNAPSVAHTTHDVRKSDVIARRCSLILAMLQMFIIFETDTIEPVAKFVSSDESSFVLESAHV